MTAEAYPLQWPQGWPRHRGPRDSESRFRGPTYRWDRVMRDLLRELERIGATNPVISTNQPLRRDGYPYAQERRIDDPGVAVYFTRGKRALVMAQDRFDTVMGNTRSLAMAIEGMRQMERHGGATMLERAFEGFLAIAPPSARKPWREVFGVSQGINLSPDALTHLYRTHAKHRHPDRGGSETIMAELNAAYEEAKCELGIG